MASKQRHLYEWVGNLRDQVLKRRREIYRVFAAQLAKRYHTVLREDFDLRILSAKPAPDPTILRPSELGSGRIRDSPVRDLPVCLGSRCQCNPNLLNGYQAEMDPVLVLVSR